MISYTPGKDRLIVCFDNLNSVRATERREPFGFPLFVKEGWGVLGVMVKRMDWFQCPDLKERMVEIRDSGLFDAYETVGFYGSSMGGFGAMAFSPLAGEKGVVVAFAPQSTLRPRIVKFERRYTAAMRRGDWSGDYNDVANHLNEIGRAYIIFDPYVEEDRLHAARMTGPTIEHLPVRSFTHKIPPMLKRMDILKTVAREGLSGQMSRRRFYHLIRARRTAAPYLVALIDRAHERGHTRLAHSAARVAVKLRNNWKTRHALRRLNAAVAELDDAAE
ncbi:hypothetical protein [Celeribacter litoreus]|uniref:hypothetical protein n=1 Tax=Celeribacter litoreus TaxID=2876714 RepID=UPI001CCA178F|nr:hypothetical protein [Celeribacter litoreus]